MISIANKLLNSLGLLFALILVSCKDCKEVEIPYTVTEEVEEELSYHIGDSKWNRVSGMSLFNELPKLQSETEVSNTSEHGGVFKLIKKYETTQDEVITFEDDKYIAAGQTVMFTFETELQPYITIKDKKTEVEVIAPSVKVQKNITKYQKCNTCEEDCYKYLSKHNN